MAGLKSSFPDGCLQADVSSTEFIHLQHVAMAPSSNQQVVFDDGWSHVEPFCTQDNVNQCISYVSKELVSFGLISLYDPASDCFDLTRLLNAVYGLLQQLHRSTRLREDLEDSKCRTLSDLEHLQQEKKRLQATIGQLKRDLSQEQIKQNDLLKVNNVVNNQLKLEKEEVKRLLALVQNRDVQYRHSIRKTEGEMVKLKERLHSLLIDKTDRRINMDISEPLTRTDGKRARWKTGCSNVEDMYRGVVSHCENREKLLLLENQELRLWLKKIHKEVTSLLLCIASKTKSSSDRHFEERSPSVDAICDGNFEMPVEMVGDGIIAKTKQQIDQLKQFLQTSANSGISGEYERFLLKDERQKQEIEKLQKKVERYRSLVEFTQRDNTSAEGLMRTMSLVDADAASGALCERCKKRICDGEENHRHSGAEKALQFERGDMLPLCKACIEK